MVGVCRGIVAGVAELHAAHIVHGDVKLDNVLVMGPACAKLADLSGSKRLPQGASLGTGLSGLGMMHTAGMGPPDFGDGSVRYAADDVWALGVALLGCFFGGLQAWMLAERSLRAEVAAQLDAAQPDFPVRASELVQDLWAAHSSQGSISAGISRLAVALSRGSRAEADAAAAKLGPARRAQRRELLRRLRQPCCADFDSLSMGEEALLAARPYLRAAAGGGDEEQRRAMAQVQQLVLSVLALVRRALTVDQGARPSAAELLQDPLFALAREQQQLLAGGRPSQGAQSPKQGRLGLLSCMR